METDRTRVKKPWSQRAGWLAQAGTVLVRTWIAFSVSAFAVGLSLCALDGDNPLRSDDPYIGGGVAAGFCASFALLHSLAKTLGASSIRQRLAYFGPAVGLSVVLMGADLLVPASSEGSGYMTCGGMLIAVIAAAMFPLTAMRLNKVTVLCASLPGLLYFAGLWIALSAMHALHPAGY